MEGDHFQHDEAAVILNTIGQSGLMCEVTIGQWIEDK
jgi:hypothetical protein